MASGRHRLLPFGDGRERSREFRLEVLGLVDVDQLLEVFPVSFPAGMSGALSRRDIRVRGELLEVKAFEFPQLYYAQLLQQRGEMLPEIAGAFEMLAATSLLAQNLEMAPAWAQPSVLNAFNRRGAPALVTKCRECDRWNYHLATCSSRRPR